MEIKIILDQKDLGNYIDYRFTVYRNGKEGLNIWTGEPSVYWDWTVKMITDTVKSMLMKEKPEEVE
jgi:hypothetical protein